MESHSDRYNEKLQKLKERQVRWHDKQLNLSSVVINLFITLAIATIGFILKNQQLTMSHPLYSGSVGRVSIFILLFSMGFGIVALVTRLYNFRYTKDIVKQRILKLKLQQSQESNFKISDERQKASIEIGRLRCVTKILGNCTWFSLWAQMIFYFLAVIVISTSNIVEQTI